ncbi:MAG: MotA/TolQ/ExbB proton channel family protein [Deltaproteobacteria bacterium]|nr:MotA/TolQ/ExbB proton channel family protein [Deltaproteobacteria bacterium]
MQREIPASLSAYVEVGGPLFLLMLAVSLLAVAVALGKTLEVLRFRGAVRQADERVVESVRRGDLDEARRLAERLPQPVRSVFATGLDRFLGRAKGEASLAMRREEKRSVGRLKSLVWTLGTAGALMPFVGLLGTVIGVMESFRAIGLSQASGFAVVSSGISEALISTAAGLGVALEAVVLYNFLQNAIAVQHRDLSLLVDETLELLYALAATPEGS